MNRQLSDDGKLRIFVSSPGDVSVERRIARRVIERLQVEFENHVELDPVFWEYLPMRSTDTFQKQIPLASESHISIFILWSRLGTPLPTTEFTRPDGGEYASGTEFEFELALEAHRSRNIPDILTYRKVARPIVDLDLPDEQLQELRRQRHALQAFVDKWFVHGKEGTLKAAFTDFETPDELEEKLEAHLRHLIRDYLPDEPSQTQQPHVEPVWTGQSPFRGLHAFAFEHERIFCGRTRAVHDVVQALMQQRARHCPLTVVLGMSGSGKSSLVMAGVVPVLTEPGVVEGVTAWRRGVMRPGDAVEFVFSTLAATLLSAMHKKEDIDAVAVESLATLLEHNPEVATAQIVELLDGIGEKASLALVVDQLEELFTENRLADQRNGFINALATMAESCRVYVIATLRSDFFDRTAEIPELVRLMERDGQFHLLPPTPAEIGQMIREPAALAGLYFESDEDKGRLDDVLRDATATDPSALPLLEFALDELYQRRTEDSLLTHASYETLGGVEGALAQRAEGIYRDLPSDVQDALPSVMRALTTVGDGETLTRRRATRAELSTDAQQQLVEAFVQARLFVADEDGVRIVHEALLTHWPRLVAWFEDDQAYLKTRARVTTATKHWRRENRDAAFLLAEGKPLAEAEDLMQRHRQELPREVIEYVEASQQAARARAEKERLRSRRIMAAIGSALIVALILAAVSFVQYRTAEHLRGIAERERAEVQRQRDKVKAALVKEKKAREEVEAAKQRAETLAVLQAGLLEKISKFGDVLVAKEKLDEAKETFAAAQKIIEKLAAEDPDNPRLQKILKMSRYNVGKVDWLKTAVPEFQKLAAKNPYVASQLQSGKPLKKAHLEWLRGGYVRAIKDRQRLMTLDPKNHDHEGMLFDSYFRLAHLLVKMGRFDEADAPLQKAKKLTEAVKKAGRFNFQWFTRTVGMQFALSGWKIFLTDPDRNKPGFKQAERDRMPSMQPELVGELLINADAFWKLKRHEEALEAFLLTRAYADDLIAHNRTKYVKHLLITGTSYNRLGEFYEEQEKPADALKAFQSALDVCHKILKLDPKNKKAKGGMTYVLDNVGNTLCELKRYQEALGYYATELTVSQQLANARPKDDDLQDDVAYTHNQMGRTYHKLKRYDEALKSYRAGLAIRRGIAKRNPGDKEAEDRVAFNERRIHQVLKAQQSP